MRNYDDYSMETIKSRVYNALAEISFEEDASEDQMTRAIEWFQTHFYDQEPEPKEYRYGMRIRGYSIGCQPTDGLLRREDDHSGDYYDILVYDHKLTENETRAYSLDRISRPQPSGGRNLRRHQNQKQEETTMKNEIKKLLETDGGELKLNGIARLHRQTTTWDGSPVDKLEVIINSPDGTAYFFQKEIKSRWLEGIIAETCEALDEAMRRWTEEASKKLQNGYLG